MLENLCVQEPTMAGSPIYSLLLTISSLGPIMNSKIMMKIIGLVYVITFMLLILEFDVCTVLYAV